MGKIYIKRAVNGTKTFSLCFLDLDVTWPSLCASDFIVRVCQVAMTSLPWLSDNRFAQLKKNKYSVSELLFFWQAFACTAPTDNPDSF